MMSNAEASGKLDVLVVGAGPVGLMLAVLCERYGLSVRVVEKSLERMPYSKAFGLHARTLEHFRRLGMRDLLSDVRATTRLVLSFAKHQQVVAEFSKLQGTDFRCIGMLSQFKVERHLEACLRHTQVERGVELVDLTQEEGGPVTVTLQHKDGSAESVVCGFVGGCDGAHSQTRRLLKLPFKGDRYDETFVLADVTLEGSDVDMLSHDAQLFLYQGQRLVTFPLEPQMVRLISNRPHGGDGEASLSEFQSLLDTFVPGTLIKGPPHWLSAFNLHRRLVDTYGEGGVWLCGDAAHIHSPAGGQGLNLGLQDALNLSWKLALIRRGWVREPQRLLHSYSSERRPLALGVLKGTDRFMTLFNKYPSSRVLRLVLPRVLRVLLSVPWTRQHLMSTLAQLTVAYTHSTLTQAQGWWGWMYGGPKPGDRLPHHSLQPTLPWSSSSEDRKEEDGGTDTTLVTSQGFRHSLLLLLPHGVVPSSLVAVMSAYGHLLHPMLILPPTTPLQGPAPASTPALYTASPSVFSAFGCGWARWVWGGLLRLLGGDTAMAYLVRPDGYIAYRGTVQGVQCYLEDLYVPQHKGH